MGKYKVNQDAWRAATLALLRHMETKEELGRLDELAMTRDPEAKGRGPKPAHSDPTANSGIKLVGLKDTERYRRLCREAAAVDYATADLNDTELEIIRHRFWKHRKGVRKPCPYNCMVGLGYERTKMQEIVKRVIIKVAAALGEI